MYYYLDNGKYNVGILIQNEYRGKGFSKISLELLCKVAKQNGIKELYDTFESDRLIGYRIAEEELKGQDRANYGKEIIKKISKELADKYGKGFDSRNLYYFLNFYKTFPNILNAVSSKSNALLSWTHYRTLLQVLDKDARDWYEKEALSQTWSARTLQRNICVRR